MIFHLQARSPSRILARNFKLQIDILVSTDLILSSSINAQSRRTSQRVPINTVTPDSDGDESKAAVVALEFWTSLKLSDLG
jgi:hypothetical protein